MEDDQDTLGLGQPSAGRGKRARRYRYLLAGEGSMESEVLVRGRTDKKRGNSLLAGADELGGFRVTETGALRGGGLAASA